MVVFSGAVDSGGGRTDMVTEVLESPPQPIESFRYHCDSAFLTEPLAEMLGDKGLYGLIVLDRRESNVGWLKGKRVQPVKSAESLVPGKQRKGGQSAQRFARLRLEAIDNFYQEVAGMADDLFVPKRHEIDGILVGGPSPTKDEFLDGITSTTSSRTRSWGNSTSYTDESGLSDLVDAGQAALAEADLMDDKSDMEEFFEELNGGKLATYGFEQTRRNLIMGSVDRLLVSEDLREDVVIYECPNDHEEYETIDRRNTSPEHTCSDCGEEATEVDREDAIDHLMSIADQRGTETHFISTDFEKGEQLLTAFGGYADFAVLDRRVGRHTGRLVVDVCLLEGIRRQPEFRQPRQVFDVVDDAQLRRQRDPVAGQPEPLVDEIGSEDVVGGHRQRPVGDGDRAVRTRTTPAGVRPPPPTAFGGLKQ